MGNEAYASAEMASALRDGSVEYIRNWSGLIDDPDTVAYLNYLDDRLPVPVEETKRGQRIIMSAASATLDRAVKQGNVSQMKASMGLTNQSAQKEAFFTEVADRLAYEGSVGLVFGPPGSGKTSVILDSAVVWRAVTGGKIIANIDWAGADAQFSSDSEMLELMASYQGPVLALLDEIAQELSGFGTGSKKAEAFSDALLFIRKREEKHGEYAKRGSVLAVAHTRTKTAKEIRRVASFAIEKPKRSQPDKVRILDSEGGRDQWQEYESYQGITATAEKYDEHQASEFHVSDQYDDSEESTDNRGAADSDIERALDLHLNEGWTQENAAKAVGYSAGWLSDKVKKYRKGELNLNLDSGEK